MNQEADQKFILSLISLQHYLRYIFGDRQVCFFVTYKEYMTPSLHCYTEKIIFPLIPKVSHSNTSYHTQITAWFVRFDRAALEYQQFAIDLSNYKFIVTIIVDIG